MTFGAVFWDNDGVLVDTEHLYFEATRDTLATAGIQLTPADYLELFLVQGKGAWHLAEERGIPALEVTRLKKARNDLYSRRLAEGPRLIPGVADVLASLHGRYVMGVVTSSRRDHFEVIHRETGVLKHFDFVLTADDLERVKPHPDPYLRAIERSGLSPDACVAIEDSERGLEAATLAGIRCIVVPTVLTRGCSFRGAHRILGSVGEVPEAILGVIHRLLLSLAALSVLALQPQGGADAPIAITDVSVVDVNAGVSRSNQTVVIRNSTIESVGPASIAAVPAGARIVDGAGKFLMPGLWDMHTHMAGDGSVLELFLAAGITGLRDMGGSAKPLAEARRLIGSGQWEGPRLVFSGPMLRGPQSPSDRSSAGATVVRTPDDARAAVDALVDLGVDFVKVHDFLSRDSYLAIAAEARARKIRYSGHVPVDISPVEASDAGQYSIEHFDFLPKACAAIFKEEEDSKAAMPADVCGPAAVDAILQHLVRNGTWLCPTLAQFQYLSPGHWRAIFAGFKSLVPALRTSGIGILAGTDWQSSLESRGGEPGMILHEEIAALADAGFTPAEALRSATLNPARFLGLADQLGSVEPGKVADLVLLSADPLKDIRNTERIVTVMRDGQFVRGFAGWPHGG